MARMTGVVPALYQNFMQTLDRKRAMQEQQLEQQRQQVELQSMFKSMGFEAPPGMTMQTAPMYVRELQTKQAEQARQKQVEDQTKAEADEKARKQLEKDTKDKAELDANIKAFHNAYPEFNLFEVYDEPSLNHAISEANRMQATKKFKEDETFRTEENIRLAQTLRPKEEPQGQPTYNQAQINWVENELTRAARGQRSASELIKDPAVSNILDQLEQYDPATYARLGRIYQAALIMESERNNPIQPTMKLPPIIQQSPTIRNNPPMRLPY